MRRFLAFLLVAAVVAVGVVGTVIVIRGRGGVEVRRDLVFKEVDGETLRLDAYLPDGDGPHPAVILIFGGGWVMGSKESWAPYGEYLAEQGFVAIALQYRLAPAHPFPAAIDDVRDGTAWVRQHAIEFDIDPARLAAVGGSAGGHLAALLATEGTGPLDQGSRVAAAVSWAGPMDLHASQYPPESQGYISEFLACTPATCNEDEIDAASPIDHVDAFDPPMLLAHGDSDLLVPLDQAQRMAARLDAVGVPNQLLIVPNAGHDERILPAVGEPTTAFLRERLGVAPAAIL
jgi:acetyl esterase/lipase